MTETTVKNPDELKEINDVIKEVAAFVREDNAVKQDFEEYIRTVGSESDEAVFNYIFERHLDGKSIIEMYAEKSPGAVATALTKSVSSVFEVKRQTKTGFELYNIINEKMYNTVSLVRMTNFRGIGSGQYVVARIFQHGGEHYLLEISGVLPIHRRDEALRYSVAKIVANPELVYLDNPEKLKELEANVKSLHKKFVEYFGADEVVTTNKFADELISLYNDYAETGAQAEFQDKIQTPDEYKFFSLSGFNSSYDNFLENSMGGFASHSEVYDVGVIFDEELGLYAVPFYATFNKIFEGSVEGADECIKYFLHNDKVCANLIRRVAAKHKNFMDVVNKALGANFTLDQLLRRYKQRYLEHKIFSPTAVLYKSRAFSNVLGIVEEETRRPEIDAAGVGRNDPCPCNSGRKYKQCCLK